MPTQLQLRRGTTGQNQSFTGAAGELSFDTDESRIRAHDGSTAGGHPVAKKSEVDGYIANTEPRIAGFNSSGQYTTNFVPSANVTYDLGTTNLRWRDLYLSGNTIILGSATLSATGETITLPAGSSIEGTGDLSLLIDDRMQVGNVNSILANTNAYIGSVDSTRASDLANTNSKLLNIETNLLGTNTAIRSLVTGSYVTNTTFQSVLANTNAYIGSVDSTRASDLANTNAYIASVSATERSALANTNAYIASVQSDVDTNESTELAHLANTNAYIASVDSARASNLANTNAYIASNLANTNAYIASVDSSRASDLANTNAYIASVQSDVDTNESTELAHLANTNAKLLNIETNLLGTNTAIRSLVTGSYVTNTTFQSALANTNAYIGSVSGAKVDTTTFNSALANTNAYIGSVDSSRASNLANTNAKLLNIESNLLSTNTDIRLYIDNEISALVNSAPSTLDTLNELAAALGDDANFATTVTTNLGQKLGASATVTLSGDVTGTASFSANAVTITTTVVDDSHNHIISNVDGLQTALDGKVPVNANFSQTANTLTSASATQQVVDSWSTSTYISAKYICQVKDSGTSDRQVSEVLVVHDGSSSYLTEYAIVDTNGIIATFQTDISGGNVRLLVTPTVTNSVIKVVRFAVTA